MRRTSQLLAVSAFLVTAPAFAFAPEEPQAPAPVTLAQAPEPDLSPIEALVAPPFVAVLPPRRPASLDRPIVARPARPTAQRAAVTRTRNAATPIEVASAAPARRCAALCGRFILIGVGF